MDLNLAKQIVINKAQQYGVDPVEAMSLWQQEGSGTTDLALQGRQLSRNRGRAIGPFQVVPYYHPDFPINGSFEEQADYAIKEWASGGNTLMDRVKNYYGSGKPPKGDPTPEQYAASIAKRIMDARMAGDITNGGMPVPATTYPLSGDFGEEMPTEPNMMDILLQQYMQKIQEPAAQPRQRPSLKDMMLNMGLSILGNPQGAMGSPVAGIAQGIQQGRALSNQEYDQQLERDRQAQMDEQKKAHDMIWAAQVAQNAGGQAAGGDKRPAILRLAYEYARTRGRTEPNEQDLNDANKIADPERAGAVAAAQTLEKGQNKIAVEAAGNWPKTSRVYGTLLDSMGRTQTVINRMMQLLDSNPTVTGGLAGLFKLFPSDARAFSGMADMVKSNIALDMLQELKSLSPSGASGFGALSEGELRVIQNYLGTIDQYSDPKDVKRVLEDITKRLTAMQADANRGYYEDAAYVDRVYQQAPLLKQQIQPLKQDRAPDYQSPGDIYRQNLPGVAQPQQQAAPTAPAAPPGFDPSQWEIVQ